jgi:hypothetical protein
MFGFFKKAKPAPPLCTANPGIGTEAKFAFANGQRTWSENVDIVRLAAAVFKQHGHSLSNEKIWLQHASGLTIVPQIVGIQPLDNGGVQTVTTMQANHPTLFPKGVFEYQHSAGDTIADAVSKGLDQWVQLDFVPLLDSLKQKPDACTVMQMEFPAAEGKPARVRRAVLGPVAHLMLEKPTEEEEHPFCSCCFLTNSFEAFKDLIEGDGFYALRFFAARDQNGTAQADCRVNGEDWEPGMAALREYVKKWPTRGYEFRKQYVVLQTVDKATVS